MCVVVINSCDGAVDDAIGLCGGHEAEAILAIHIAKWRDVENFCGHMLTAILHVVEQIHVALAKGVVDLYHHGAQAAIPSVAIPKAHRFEAVAEYTRIAMQPSFACRIFNAFAEQQLIDPLQGICTAITVVFVVEADGRAAITSQFSSAMLSQAAHGQHEEIGWV